MRLRKLLLSLSCLLVLMASAQWRWVDPLRCGYPVVQNQGWTDEIGKSYTRLPERAKERVRKLVWELSRNSAGLAIRFYSNASELRVSYTVAGSLAMPHMPVTGVSGVDLYSVDCDGKWRFLFGGYPGGDTLRYHYTRLRQDPYHDRGREYCLYLPLYNTVKELRIGLPEGDSIAFVPVRPERPIVVYGTSIAQGACASRPGMAWTNRVQRSLDLPLVNLGFSGNGRLEPELIGLMGELDARLYILDCLPNLADRSGEEVERLLTAAVRRLRSVRQAPILLVEHVGYSSANIDSLGTQNVSRVNEASRRAFSLLRKEGIGDLYYLSREELGLAPDAWTDYIHPSDWGMSAQAEAVTRKVREILAMPIGKVSTERPVTQRREPGSYEWLRRHEQILALNRSNPPKAVILGNSITNYWGGEPVAHRRSGVESWERVMRPAGFHNLGYGWDRIENVLWRVYHDELSGYEAEKVVLMIGTNNMGFNTDDEIVDGLRFLLAAIRERQPKAAIKVVGILPRRNAEAWVRGINLRIRQMAESAGYRFVNPGERLLGADGKVDESLFSDGLHPNEAGYNRIVEEIAR